LLVVVLVGVELFGIEYYRGVRMQCLEGLVSCHMLIVRLLLIPFFKEMNEEKQHELMRRHVANAKYGV